MKHLYHLLFRDQPPPKFFDVIPVDWLFDASQVAILVVFLIFGTAEAFKQLRR